MIHLFKAVRPGNVNGFVGAIFLLALMTACGPLINLPTDKEPSVYYTLTAAGKQQTDLPDLPVNLLIEKVKTPGDLETNRIALHPTPLEIQYFANARWADRLPRMLQNLLVISFENSGKINSVGTDTMGLPADYRLKVSLRDYQADYPEPGAAPSVNVGLSFKLVRKSPLGLVDAVIISKKVTAQHNKTRDIVEAFDQATLAALQDSVTWTLEAIARDRQK